MVDSVTPSPAPRGELTPEIVKAIEWFERAAYRFGASGYHEAPVAEAARTKARAALKSAIVKALSGPPSGQESEEWCPRCDGCGWYEGGKTLQTKCEQCGGTGKVSREAVCSFCKESGHYGFECKKLAATDVFAGQESRAGGAAPQEPDFQKAPEATGAVDKADALLWRLLNVEILPFTGPAQSLGYMMQVQPLLEGLGAELSRVRATLDQAEKEIARLREDASLWAETARLAEDRIEALLLDRDGLRVELARLRSSPPEETQRVTRETLLVDVLRGVTAAAEMEDTMGALTRAEVQEIAEILLEESKRASEAAQAIHDGALDGHRYSSERDEVYLAGLQKDRAKRAEELRVRLLEALDD